ncbi:protein-tyrosine phosphatase-like protein [Crucibulum laeve]|uniref:Protein-tyrosine phosphatase-like protein n=1 Tax=Crucibulum laeve TaxID=68775 RepID=A0A5C3LKS6_9AGAR|nr:protein-tyrosine phosphatase-like protein [Crucibulum laeve]
MPSYLSSQASTSTTSTIEQKDLREDQRMLNALSPANRPFPLTSTCPRPIPNSYWATPLLVACEYPWSPKNPNKPKVDALLRAGVRTFIDLTECGELVPYASILSDRATLLGIDPATLEYHRFPIRDRCLPNSVEDMYKVMAVLRDNEDRERISAVHCRGGIGRTGMVIGCWLVESGLVKNGEEALDAIAREWRTVEKCKRFPHSPETGPQFEFVLNFKAAPKTLRVIASKVSEAACEVGAGVSTASAGRRRWIGAIGLVAVLLTVRFTVMAGSPW